MADLIYTRNRDNKEMSIEHMMRVAPAVFTEHNDNSDRYGQVSTLDAISALRDFGYVPVQAAQKKARKKSSAEFAQHLVAFAHRDDLQAYAEDRPEIILYNSHDGLSSLKLYGGFFRAVCSNGLVAGEGFEHRMRHVKTNLESFEDMLGDVITNTPLLVDRINRMKSVYDFDEMEFAMQSAKLRWDTYEPDSGKGIYCTRDTARTLLNARRRADEKYDLWTTFNRVQESMIRGGAMVYSVSDRNKHGKFRRARPIASVNESVRVNVNLWNLADNCMKEAA